MPRFDVMSIHKTVLFTFLGNYIPGYKDAYPDVKPSRYLGTDIFYKKNSYTIPRQDSI
jgi:hypothetical protein